MVHEWKQPWTFAFDAMQSQGTTVIVDSSKTAEIGDVRTSFNDFRICKCACSLFSRDRFPRLYTVDSARNNLTLEWAIAVRPAFPPEAMCPVAAGLTCHNRMDLGEEPRTVRS